MSAKESTSEHKQPTCVHLVSKETSTAPYDKIILWEMVELLSFQGTSPNGLPWYICVHLTQYLKITQTVHRVARNFEG